MLEKRQFNCIMEALPKEEKMKIKSLLSLITLGVGVGALGLTTLVSANTPKHDAAQVEAVDKNSTAKYIYLGTNINGANPDFNSAYTPHIYAWVDGGDTTLGSWPGKTVSSLMSEGKVSVTRFVNFSNEGGIYKIDLSALNGATHFILNFGNNQPQTANMKVFDDGRYYSSTMYIADGKIEGSPDFYESAALTFDIAAALEKTTYHTPEGDNNDYYSICELTDKTQLQSFSERYDKLGGGKEKFDSATYWTLKYGSGGEGTNSENENVTFQILMGQIRNTYNHSTNYVMFLGGNSSNNATLVVAGISAATIIASASMIILRRHKNKKA